MTKVQDTNLSLTEMEKDFLIRTFMYFATSEIFSKMRTMLPLQMEKAFTVYWGLPYEPQRALDDERKANV